MTKLAVAVFAATLSLSPFAYADDARHKSAAGGATQTGAMADGEIRPGREEDHDQARSTKLEPAN